LGAELKVLFQGGRGRNKRQFIQTENADLPEAKRLRKDD